MIYITKEETEQSLTLKKSSGSKYHFCFAIIIPCILNSI